MPLVGKGFHTHDALQALFHDHLRVREMILGLAHQFPDARAKDGDHHDHYRDGCDHHQRQFHRDLKHQHQAAEQHHTVPDQHRQRHHQRLAHRLHIICQARSELAHAAGIQRAHGQPDDPAESIQPQHRQSPFRGFGKEHDAEKSNHRLGRHDPDHDKNRVPQLRHPFRPLGPAEPLPRQACQQVDEHDGQARRQRQGDHRRDENIVVRLEIMQEERRITPGGAIPDFFGDRSFRHSEKEAGGKTDSQ